MTDKPSMPSKALAKIHWIPAAEGGRKHRSVGRRYSTLARFEKELPQWPEIAWSIIADFKGELESSTVEAESSFLSPDAPLQLLEAGNRFELYEGRRLVARGEVLKGWVEEPPKITRIHANAVLQAQ